MQHVDLDIAENAFRRLSAELEKQTHDLRASEEAIHRIIGAAPWSVVSSEACKIQALDRIVQTLSALSKYTEKMSHGVKCRASHEAIVAGITLEAVRIGLSEASTPRIGGDGNVEEAIELF